MTPLQDSAHVLLVEDDPQLGLGLAEALRRSGDTVDWVRNLHDAQAIEEQGEHDMVLLDVQLPDGSGLVWLASRRAAGRDVPVIVIAARDRLEDRIHGLDMGADDYLVKPFDISELQARMRAVLRRRRGGVGQAYHVGKLSVFPGPRAVLLNGEPMDLPNREFTLLLLLLERRGRVVTRRQIEAALYRLDHGVESNTLEVYVHNLRKRLGTDLIRTVRGVGYVVDAE